VSIQDLRPDSTFYLENIYQLLADSNGSISSTVVQPPLFSPPRYAIWVNSLWFSSLAISLTSALLATLLQQWIRRYIKVTQPPAGSSELQARIRQYFFSDVDNMHFLLATDAVPTLLHLSVFLFFAGLLILLRNRNHIVFNAVVVWVVLCAAVYAYITLLPIFRPASPYYAPLSSLAWELYTDILYLVSKLLSLIKIGAHNIGTRRPARLLRRLEEKAKKRVSGQSPELDAGILESLLDTLGEDGAREEVFEAIPGFYSPRIRMQGFKKRLSSEFDTKFVRSINQFLDRTMSSDSVSELTKSRRLLTCLKATDTVLGDRVDGSIIDGIIRIGNWNEVPPSPEIGDILKRWRNSTDSLIAPIGSCVIARIIGSVEKHDDTWMTLTMSQLGMTEEDLRRHLKQGDSVLLANLTNATRLFFEKRLQFQDILRSISGFNVQGILPDQQCDFCTLWNEVVQYVQSGESFSDCDFILEEIYPVYNALHPTVPMVIATIPDANNDSLRFELLYPPCADPQSYHPPTAINTAALHQATPAANEPFTELDIPHASQQIAPVTTPSLPDNPSSLDPLDPLGGLPVGIIPPAQEHSNSTTTSQASVSDSSDPVISPGTS
jgi:hypothetical protein